MSEKYDILIYVFKVRDYYLIEKYFLKGYILHRIYVLICIYILF